MMYELVDEVRASKIPVAAACNALGVARSGFYQWKKRRSHNRHDDLDQKIRTIFTEHRGRYGSPRITKTLHMQGDIVNHKRVEARMKELGLRAKQSRKYKATTDSNHKLATAKNILDQDFFADAPDQKWVGDITAIWTTDGWLYLAVVIDLYSRRVIGWSMSRRMKKQLVCDALLMAL